MSITDAGATREDDGRELFVFVFREKNYFFKFMLCMHISILISILVKREVLSLLLTLLSPW